MQAYRPKKTSGADHSRQVQPTNHQTCTVNGIQSRGQTLRLRLATSTTAYFSFRRVLARRTRRIPRLHQADTDSSWQKDTAALPYTTAIYTQLQASGQGHGFTD
jgi:hypothetical protein